MTIAQERFTTPYVSKNSVPTPEDVAAAAAHLDPIVRHTPVLEAESLNRLAGCRVLCKGEHLQHTGAFKYRGASNAVTLLPPGVRAVATHSSGNHGAALAAAAARRGLAAQVVMPEGAVRAKVEAVRAFGASVHFSAPNQQAREQALAQLATNGCVPVSPYDHPHVIAGQGTAALEFLAQYPDLEALIVPVGGAGLLAGALLAATAAGLDLPVYGAEPAGADDTWRSLEAGHRVHTHHPDTLADGLVALVGALNFSILRQYGPHIIRISDADILMAVRLIWQHLRQIVEPSAAIALAAVLQDSRRFRGKCVGLVLTGSNVDLDPLAFRLHERTGPPAARFGKDAGSSRRTRSRV